MSRVLIFSVLEEAFGALAIPGSLLVDSSLHRINNGVHLVPFEFGKLPLAWKPGEGLQYVPAGGHQVQQLGIAIPVLLPTHVSNPQVQLLKPMHQLDLYVLASLDEERCVADLLAQMQVLEVQIFGGGGEGRLGVLGCVVGGLWRAVDRLEPSRFPHSNMSIITCLTCNHSDTAVSRLDHRDSWNRSGKPCTFHMKQFAENAINIRKRKII